MQIAIRHGKVDVSPTLRATVEEKVGRVGRFLDVMERAEVRFLEEHNPRIADKEVCEDTIEGRGHHIRTKVAAADPFAAIDAATVKLEHQLHKLRSKLRSRSHPRRNGTQPAPAGDLPDEGELLLPDELDGEEHEQGGYRIGKTTAFEMKPMTPEEAAMQMDLLGHDFYFFRSSETTRSAVVYRRGAGDVGLIDEAG